MRLAAKLPNHSRYKASVLDDEDYARAIESTGATPGPMTMGGYTPEVAALKDLIDWVKALYSLTFSVNAGKAPPSLPETPRPKTAFDRIRNTDVMERHRKRVNLMIGD